MALMKTVIAVFLLQSLVLECHGEEDMYEDLTANQLMDYWRENPPTDEGPLTFTSNLTFFFFGLTTLCDHITDTFMPKNYTTASGGPVAEPGVSLTVGKKGPILLSDMVLIEELLHFVRERIPERVVHAKGAGAWGYFTVTSTEITKYCSASLFSTVGQMTKAFVRFSVINGELGSADTLRGAKGFAVKFYTVDGNWDLVGINNRVFPIRDPILFPSLVHAGRRNPVTHLRDPNMRWDFLTSTPSTVMSNMFSFGSAGIPWSYRHMDGFGVHAFKVVNAKGQVYLAKFSLKTHQGLKNMDNSVAEMLRGKDPDFYVRDLYNSIARGHHPKWTLGAQIMTLEQAKSFRWNPIDATKFWPEDEFPVIPIGELTLDKNPANAFADVEQVGFCPRRMVPGIEPSNDKLLQGRMFSYDDTIIYRLGVNSELMKVNMPLGAPPVANRQRDGFGRTDDNQAGSPNYVPNSYNGPRGNPRGRKSPFPVFGNATKYDTMFEDNFSQPTYYWKRISDAEKSQLIKNIAMALKYVAPFIQKRAIHNFGQVHPDFGNGIEEALATK